MEKSKAQVPRSSSATVWQGDWKLFTAARWLPSGLQPRRRLKVMLIQPLVKGSRTTATHAQSCGACMRGCLHQRCAARRGTPAWADTSHAGMPPSFVKACSLMQRLGHVWTGDA